MRYRFSVENTKTENASFPFKTAMSKANVKTYSMGVQNGPIIKNGALFFGNFYFGLKTSYEELI